MFKNKSKKTSVLLATLALVLCLAVGVTVAYLTDVTYLVKNIFEPGVVTTEVAENLVDQDGVTVKKDVKIKNTGNVESYIRATYVVNWKNATGDVYGKYEPVEGTDYILKLKEYSSSDEAKWIQGADGFYYWTKPVISDKEDGDREECYTGVLIESIYPIGEAPEGYFLSVEILGSGIQSKPDSTVHKAWPSVEVNNGKLVLSE